MKRMLLVSTALSGAIAFQLGMEPPRLANHGVPPYTEAEARSAICSACKTVRPDIKLPICSVCKDGALNIARPNKELTPGAVRTTNRVDICGLEGRKGTQTLRLYNHDKSAFDERVSSIFSQYQLERTPEYTLDHLIPLGIGGADNPKNIWPQPKVQALLKDKIEFWMRDQICHVSLPDNEASELISRLQREIATDWYAAYKHYLDR